MKVEERKLRDWLSKKIIQSMDNNEPMFMGVPDKWYDNEQHCCCNGHINSSYVKSELKGCVCLDCGEPSHIFPDDVTKEELLNILK